MSTKVIKRRKTKMPVIEVTSPGVPPFRIGENHNVYEWAMIYCDLHPYPAHLDRELLHAKTAEGMEYRLSVLRQVPKAWSVFHDLLRSKLH